MRSRTMIVDLRSRPAKARRPADDGVAIRPATRADIARIGELYFEAYEPGVAGEDVKQATADIEAAWNGDFGELWEEASVVAETDEVVVGALLTVREAPWEETPDGPFIIELFVDAAHRRRGIARQLLEEALDRLTARGATSAALRVRTDNVPARNLYRSVGFTDWAPS